MNKLCLFLIILGLFAGCNAGGKRKGLTNLAEQNGGNGNGNGNGNGSGVGPGDNELGPVEGGDLEARSEILQIVDPKTGALTTKLTVPKNFKGTMYIRALNVESLKDKKITVRFRFGMGGKVVDVDKVIVSTPKELLQGLNMEILALEIEESVFEDIALRYSLWDYNVYENGEDPVTDNLDAGLYCRGLKLEDDYTFLSENGDNVCDEPGEKCLFSYVNVYDRGLVLDLGTFNYPTIPTLPQIDVSNTTGDYENPSTDEARINNAKKCLPDNGRIMMSNDGQPNPYLDYKSGAPPLLGSPLDPLQVRTTNTVVHTTSEGDYMYHGPYESIGHDDANSDWQMKPSAAIWDHLANNTDPVGLFMRDLGCGSIECGAVSLMFPRAARKLNFQKNREYLGSVSGLGTYLNTPGKGYDSETIDRTVRSLLAAGDTEYMDGCSVRVTEKTHQCNVTGTIEILVKENGEVTRTIHSTNIVKLQLVKESEFNSIGEQQVFDGLATCESSATCSNSECCYAGRCWNKSLVGECSEDANNNGNLEIGDQCTTDFQCTSLCCREDTGTCQPHENNTSTSLLCSKPAGGFCIAKTWCKRESIRDCRIIKTAPNPVNGAIGCQLICYNRLEHGNCVNNSCIAPQDLPIPEFDPQNPDCSEAQDPPGPGDI